MRSGVFQLLLSTPGDDFPKTNPLGLSLIQVNQQVKIGIPSRLLPAWGSTFLSRLRPGLLRNMAISESVLGPELAAETSREDGTQLHTSGKKLFGREFYRSIGSPKFVVAPMVDRSEFVR